jgi:hypothetical protein
MTQRKRKRKHKFSMEILFIEIFPCLTLALNSLTGALTGSGQKDVPYADQDAAFSAECLIGCVFL